MAHFNKFCNDYLFFNFINKCQKEILRCAPPSSYLCDFSIIAMPKKSHFTIFAIYTKLFAKHEKTDEDVNTCEFHLYCWDHVC